MNEIMTQFHMMAKPTGPVCNLDCRYCYYLSKQELLSSDDHWRMSNSVLERFVRQYINCQTATHIEFSWHGGEPTLLGIDFFEKVVRLQKLNCPPNKFIINNIQTNGTLLDDQWCAFFRKHHFMVGLSIDGPQDLHDRYRLDRKQQPTFERVFEAAKLLKKYGVEFNTLTVLSNSNAEHPLRVYRFLRDELGSRHTQFLPCVEPKNFTRTAPLHWDTDTLPRLGDPQCRPGYPDSIVTDWSVDPVDFGEFMCSVFDEWLHNDVGKVFVHLFDNAVNLWMGLGSPAACAFADTCGKGLVIEHDGNVYTCDHLVYPEYCLGNIKEKTLTDMLYSTEQVAFGLNKTDSLPDYCKRCKWVFACNGECPRNRFLLTPDGEQGLNYYCRGLKRFFKHIDPWIRRIACEIHEGRTADNVMRIARKNQLPAIISTIPRPQTKLNAKCPCGSSRKYKKCCYKLDIAGQSRYNINSHGDGRDTFSLKEDQ